MVRTSALSVRLAEDLKRAIEKAAADDDRTVSQFVERTLVAHLKKAGYWPPK